MDETDSFPKGFNTDVVNAIPICPQQKKRESTLSFLLYEFFRVTGIQTSYLVFSGLGSRYTSISGPLAYS